MAQKNKILFSAISGNVLEYYDFTVYSIFSIAIGQTFFPGNSAYIQNILSLAVFALGFITRPVGGILFGYIGDKYGRRIALICSMLGMTIPTFGIGLIPSFHEIGYLAPILLTIMRLIQGLCISGEGTGAAIFVLEHLHNFRPGLITGFVHGSNIAGTLMASVIGIIIEKYVNQYYSEAWRFAFLLGGFLGLIGFYFRLWVSETPVFQEIANSKSHDKKPLSSVFRTALPLIILTTIVGGSASSIVYMVKTYVNNFYTSVMMFDNTVSLLYLSFASLIMMITMPISGALADAYGKIRITYIAATLILLFSLPVLYLMSTANVICQIFALASLGVLGGLLSGTAYIIVISLFSPEQRYTGVGFSYNLGVALFGGTAPMIARYLIETTGLLYAPAFYLMFTSGLLIIVLYYFSKHQYINHI